MVLIYKIDYRGLFHFPWLVSQVVSFTYVHLLENWKMFGYKNKTSFLEYIKLKQLIF